MEIIRSPMESRTPCIYKFFNSLLAAAAVPEHIQKTAAGRHLELFIPNRVRESAYVFPIPLIYIHIHNIIRKTAARTTWIKKKRPFYAQRARWRSFIVPCYLYIFIATRCVFDKGAAHSPSARRNSFIYICILLYCTSHAECGGARIGSAHVYVLFASFECDLTFKFLAPRKRCLCITFHLCWEQWIGTEAVILAMEQFCKVNLFRQQFFNNYKLYI